MEIIKSSNQNMTPEEKYFMITSPEIMKMSDLEGSEITIHDWIVYQEPSRETGELNTVLSIKTEMGTYATNSPTFIECFDRIVECFGKDFSTIKIYTGQSKRGRDFLQCVYVK